MAATLVRLKANRFRWAGLVMGACAALALCRWWLLEHQAFIQSLAPGCHFQRLTGCYCPGCGGTRAFFALLHGDLGAAWRMNPLLLSGLAVGGAFALLHAVEWLGHGKIRLSNKIRMTAAAGWWLGGAVVAFWILRNLPWWPCTLLAPGRG